MKKIMIPLIPLVCLTTVTCFTSAHAAVVLQYDSLLPASGGSNTALSIVGTTDISLVSAPSANNSLGSNAVMAAVHGSQTNVQGAFGDQNDLLFRFGSSAGGNGVLSGTVANSLAIGAYIEFSFSAAADLTLDQFSFHLFNNSNNGANYSARDVGLFVDVDGGGFNQFGALDETATGNGNQGTITFSDSVSAESGDVVTYRLAFTDRTRTNNDLQAATRIGDVQISATAVPEPSSTFLLGLGGLTLILRRRK